MSGNIYEDAALKYAKEYGWAVFPVDPKTKRPLTPHGCKDAKKIAGPIINWWKTHKNASIGVATGSISGIIVIDLDMDSAKGYDGFHELAKWEQANGSLPDTARSITGRGGNHLFFRYSGSDIKNRAGVLEGVDVRGEGGYVILPPSMHPNGTEYVWEQDPDETPIAEVDNTVLKLLNAKKKKRTLGGFQIAEKIKAGERNDTIFRLACSLQSQGLPDEAIIASVKATNALKCEEPLEEKELEALIASAMQYEKGEFKQRNKWGEWRKPKFEYRTDKSGNEFIKQSIPNMEEAIECDEKLFGRILYNEMTSAICVLGNLPWLSSKGIREWTDQDDSYLRSYLEDGYGLTGRDKVFDALSNVAGRHRIHPLKTLLEECEKQWDGKEHIKNLLPDYLGVKPSRYVTEVLTLLILGAISRTYNPGCKFDYVPVLVGPQGKGKSTLLRFLAMSDKWFDDNFNSLEGKDSFEKLNGKMMVEMAELQAMKRTKDVEAIKSFITSTTDNYRPPYGRRTIARPRACVLTGTTNSGAFLVDMTGNRRFLPIPCYEIEPKKDLFGDTDAVKAEIMQVWGEGMHIHRKLANAKGEVKLVLSPEMQEEAVRMQQRYTEEDVKIGIIQDWLDKKKIGERICIGQIWKELFTDRFGEPRTPPKKAANEISEIMREKIAGWKFIGQQRVDGYGRPRCYEKFE